MHFKTKNSQKIKLLKPQSAFTIVELLVVIVIIGILATIVIIFYIGTHDKAIDGSLQADLKGASTVLELDKANGDLYPSTKESANDSKGLKSSNGTTLDYAYSSGDNSYCLTATKEGRSYYINSEGRVPVQGSCPVASVASFYRGLGSEVGNDWGNQIIQTSDNGHIVTGGTESFGAGRQDMLLAKYDSNNNLSWSRTWGGEYDDWGNAIIQTNDGGYAITGVTKSYGAGNEDMFLTKFSSSGNLLWSKTWGGTLKDLGKSIIQAVNGDLIITGTTGSYGVGGSSTPQNEDMFLTKFSSDGNLLWSKTWGGTNQEMGIELIQSGDGGYITVGDTGSYGAGTFDVFLNKYNQNGDLLWSRTWGGTNWDYGYSIAKTNNGDYVVTGSTLSYGAGLDDMFLTKFSSDGALLWSRTWGGAKYDWGNSVIQTNDGGYSIAGTTESYSGESDNATVLVKYSVDGLLLWNKSWNRFYQSWGTSVIQTNSGNYLTVGESYDREKSNYDMYILEYNSNGINIGCSLSECQSPTASVSSPSVTTLSPIATMTSPNVTIASPTATTTDPFPPPPPQMTVTFSSQELYIAYPGESQTVCKEWTVPNGKYIKGFQVSQETESEYDYFTVSLDEVEIYNKSGILSNEYINTSNTPGTTLKACMSADSSYQEGYGGEVTGVVYD